LSLESLLVTDLKAKPKQKDVAIVKISRVVFFILCFYKMGLLFLK
jgi:hypothetical protein